MVLKTDEDHQRMRQAGRVVAKLLKYLESQVRPGIETGELDRLAEEFIRREGAEPAFKGYYGYPATICVSVNEEVVHGIPGPRRLQEGDIVGVDVGAVVDGYFADAARTFPIGRIDAESQRLLQVTRESLNQGIRRAIEGNRVSDISWAVQSFAEKNGYSVVRQYVGHGIGRKLHDEPQVPNYGRPNEGPRLVAGMALAIEPMVNVGSHEVEILKDGWTAVTRDRKRSCHFEETVIVGKGCAEILTQVQEF